MAEGDDLEIVYELHIENNLSGGADDIMGIVDNSDTCANWAAFKSYLIQNIGTSDDITVAYIDSEGDEVRIRSERDYQTALEYSRKQARKGQTIVLKIKKKKRDYIKMQAKHHHKKTLKKHGKHYYLYDENNETKDDSTEPPAWFTKYMEEFKEDMMVTMFDIIHYYIKGNETDSTPIKTEPMEPEIKKKKSISEEELSDYPEELYIDKKILHKFHKLHIHEKKLERKYEAKLEKLEHKARRMLDKKTRQTHNRCEKPTRYNQALAAAQVKSGGLVCVKTPSEATASIKSTKFEKPHKQIVKMVQMANASPNEKQKPKTAPEAVIAEPDINSSVLSEQTKTEVASRGQIVRSRWEIMNSGVYQWPAGTEMRFSWGSSALMPLQKAYKCPLLKPGQTAVVEIAVQMPDADGRYEGHWQFFQNDVRFGQWLECIYEVGNVSSTTPTKLEQQVSPVVSPPPPKPVSPRFKDNFIYPDLQDLLPKIVEVKQNNDVPTGNLLNMSQSNKSSGKDSDSDNISVISGTSQATSDDSDYVIVPDEIGKYAEEMLKGEKATTASVTTVNISSDSEENSDNNNNEANKSENTEKIEKNEDVKTPDEKYQSHAYVGVGHSTFGDPNFSQGPNGPRFPAGYYQFPNMPQFWKNGPPNDFLTTDGTNIPQYDPLFTIPPPVHGQELPHVPFPPPPPHELFSQPPPPASAPNFINQVFDGIFKGIESLDKRFVFTADGLGYEGKERRPGSKYSYVFDGGNKDPVLTSYDDEKYADSPIKLYTPPVKTEGNEGKEGKVGGSTENVSRSEGEALKSSMPNPLNDDIKLQSCLRALHEMGFDNIDRNIQLLMYYNYHIDKVIEKLI